MAAIDHNKHLNRPVATNSSGEVIYAMAYNRRSKRFVPTKVLVSKEYKYIPDLITRVFMENALLVL